MVAGCVCFLLLLTVASAGCIGDQTTDIMLGNQSIGKITITPVYENMFSNNSLDEKFNMKLELFGMVFSKDGVTRDEAANITSGILGGDGGSQHVVCQQLRPRNARPRGRREKILTARSWTRFFICR